MSDCFANMIWAPLDHDDPPNLIGIARLYHSVGMWGLLGQNTEGLAPPASKAAVEGLEEREVRPGMPKYCPICSQKFKMGTSVKRLPCYHIFHNECIMPWLGKTNSCPFCAYELPTGAEDYERCKETKKRILEREKEFLISMGSSVYM